MPATVADIETLKDYIGGVMERAEHHANGVDEVCLTIAGAIIWRKDAGTELQVLARGGVMKNVLWVRVRDERYALSFNHESGEIELRRGTTHGAVIESFSNATPRSRVKQVFASL
ncbi:MAG: hypothetical protein ACO1SX_23940 [Actinomycetota bacterium]